MATAAVLLPKDSEALRSLAPSLSLLATTAKPGPLATGELVCVCGGVPLQLREQDGGKKGPGCGIPSSCQCDLRKHATGSWVRGLPPDQDGDLTPSPGAKRLFALGMFRAQEGRSQTPAGTGPDIPEP